MGSLGIKYHGNVSGDDLQFCMITFSKDQGQFISLYSDLIVYMSANYNYSSAIV